ncbi:hypothetical protein KQI63_07150 [bacterium]|nr:hypothetical protein [bacterium]
MEKQSNLKRWIVAWYAVLVGLVLLSLLVMALWSRQTPAPSEQTLAAAPDSMALLGEVPVSSVGKQRKSTNSVPSYQQGELTYAFPEAMKVGRTETLKAIVIPEGGQFGVDPRAAVEMEGDSARVVKIIVGSSVRLSLHGEGFTVDSLTSQEQAILPGLASIWLWDVTPEKGGQQRLRLLVDTTVRTPDGEHAAKTVYVDTETIHVASNLGYSLRKAMVTYFSALWELILGGLLVPVVIALIDRFRIEAKRRILPADIIEALEEEQLKKLRGESVGDES